MQLTCLPALLLIEGTGFKSGAVVVVVAVVLGQDACDRRIERYMRSKKDAVVLQNASDPFKHTFLSTSVEIGRGACGAMPAFSATVHGMWCKGNCTWPPGLDYHPGLVITIQ